MMRLLELISYTREFSNLIEGCTYRKVAFRRVQLAEGETAHVIFACFIMSHSNPDAGKMGLAKWKKFRQALGVDDYIMGEVVEVERETNSGETVNVLEIKSFMKVEP